MGKLFATWRVLPRLRARAERGHITPSVRRFAAEQIKYATAFLRWLGERNSTLASCGQIDIDAWYPENTEHGPTCLRAFLNWAVQGRHCRRSLAIPAMKVSRRAALSADERLDALGRLLTDAEIPLLRLGDPASPVPAPVADLLLAHIANRDNMNAATNPASGWLFPGRRVGQPSRPDHLSALLNEVRVPAAAARGAAIRQQLLELPAPVVADALGYHGKTTSGLIREAGGTWSRYAAGDHTDDHAHAQTCARGT